MKAVFVGLLVFLGFAAADVLMAQEQPRTIAPDNGRVLQYDQHGTPEHGLPEPATENTIRTKNLQVGGPLVRPLKAKRFSEGVKRFAQLFNPFAPADPPQRITKVGRLSSRPWTATVGLNPGQSQFLDETKDVPTLALVSVTSR